MSEPTSEYERSVAMFQAAKLATVRADYSHAAVQLLMLQAAIEEREDGAVFEIRDAAAIPTAWEKPPAPNDARIEVTDLGAGLVRVLAGCDHASISSIWSVHEATLSLADHMLVTVKHYLAMPAEHPPECSYATLRQALNESTLDDFYRRKVAIIGGIT